MPWTIDSLLEEFSPSPSMKKTVSHKKGTNSCRSIAAGILADVMARRASLATLLPAGLDLVPENDRALLQELCYGSLRHFFSLQVMVQKFLSKPLKKKDGDILALLILGSYQLVHMRIPDYATIDSSVTATTERNKEWAKKLVNAVLRNIQRELASTEKKPSPPNDEAKYDHPQWLIDQIKNDYSQDQAEIIFLANNNKAPMSLRVNVLQKTRTEYIGLLRECNIPAHATMLSPQGIQLDPAVDVETLPFFSAGAVSVQDEAAQLCAPLLHLLPELKVLDACAAPGGKTCHMLELEPSLDVTALDIDEHRNQLIYDNLNRLKLSARIIVADATKPELWWKVSCGEKRFDRILLDAPCSATGVIRHHPDIKLLRTAEDIPVLANTQLQLITALWPLLKPGGILLYTTCSILKAENDAVVSHFMQQTTDAELDFINESWGKQTLQGRQLLPQPNTHDGFYFARIRKIVI